MPVVPLLALNLELAPVLKLALILKLLLVLELPLELNLALDMLRIPLGIVPMKPDIQGVSMAKLMLPVMMKVSGM